MTGGVRGDLDAIAEAGSRRHATRCQRPALPSEDDDSVFEGDIQALAAAGITLGCNPPVNDRFCPADTLGRGQMAALLNRALDP